MDEDLCETAFSVEAVGDGASVGVSFEIDAPWYKRTGPEKRPAFSSQLDEALNRKFKFSHGQGFGVLAHLGGALEFVPVEGFAVDGALEGLEQDDGEDLAIGEALEPDVEEQPTVALVGRVAAFEAKGDGGRDEIDQQEGAEVGEQLFQAAAEAASGW